MATRQRWQLDERAFERLLAVLDPDREAAGVKYEAIRARLLRLFEWRGCRTPESLADETIDRVSRRIDSGEEIQSEEPTAYFYGVARNVLKEYWTERKKEARSEAEMRVSERSPEGESDPDQEELDVRLNCLDRCLASLPAESRELITRYYRSEKGEKISERMDLAKGLEIAPGTLRIRAHRIRRTLEDCVNKCMKG